MTHLGSGREFDLIRTFLAQARTHDPAVPVGPGDDCAIIPPFAISTDMSVEDVHFRRDWLTPEEIGYRAVVAALSDLAAVAAAPVAALISFAFGAADAEAWAPAVMQGANQALAEYDVVLAGGDVTRSERGAVIDVVVLGKVDEPVLRVGARSGDGVWVTGTLGGAAAAVAAWQQGKEPKPNLRARFARPEARIREAGWLRLHGQVHALIDLSDGIAGDASHLAAASGCRIIVDGKALPIEEGAHTAQALQGGEDYELCVAGDLAAVQQQFEKEFDLALTLVGYVTDGSGVEILNAPAAAGYDHFA